MSYKKFQGRGPKKKEGTPPRAKDRLAEMDVRPSKGRGQNFIIDPMVTENIVAFGAPKTGEKIVEIGGGLGALTEKLAPFGNLTVVEIEEKFCDDLAKKFPAAAMVNADVREVDFSEFGEDLVVFGNLPYNFSTDILFHLIAFAPSIDRAILMLQREFAERVGAPPGGKSYGVLSISVQLVANVTLGIIIPGNSFHPPAGVDSMLLQLTFPKTPKYPDIDVFWVKRVVSASFTMRRKMIKNSLKASKIVDGDAVDRGLAAANISPMRRPETLSIEEFIALANGLTAAAAQKQE